MRLIETKWCTQGHRDNIILGMLPTFYQSLLPGTHIVGEAPLPQTQETPFQVHHDLRSYAPSPSAGPDQAGADLSSANQIFSLKLGISTLENQVSFYWTLKNKKGCSSQGLSKHVHNKAEKEGKGREEWSSKCEGEVETICFSWDRESDLWLDCFQLSHTSYSWILETTFMYLQ